jgi:hypothetical protein
MLDRVSSFEIVCKRRNRMRKTEMKLVMALAVVLVGSLMLSPVMAAGNGGGFDEFGYNYQARVFVGKADGVDRVLDNAVWGDPTYANDWLVMKWSKAWDDARFHGAP